MIVIFIAFSVSLLVLSNAVFDSTERGVEKVFRSGFTGDFMIRPVSDRPCSLLGDETPIVGELTRMESLVPFDGISGLLRERAEVEHFAPQFSGMAFAENPAAGTRIPVVLFAVEAERYLSVMDGITLLSGGAFADGERAALVNAQLAETLALAPGDTIQFVIADGPTFRIRAAPVSGVFSYPMENETLARICLVDVETFSSLMELNAAVSSGAEETYSGGEQGPAEEDFNLDDLFFESSDIVAGADSGSDADAADELAAMIALAQTAGRSTAEFSAAGISSWHFLTGRLKEGVSDRSFIRRLNQSFAERGWPVEAVNWRYAGGISSLYLYWLRVIFNIGILVVLGAGFIVVNNTLVINVMSRTKEIGTMRATGASGNYVSVLFMTETFLLTLTAGIAGAFLGWLGTLLLNAADVSFSNQILVQLFGGHTLEAFVSGKNLLQAFFLVVVLGVIAWIYPVRIALSTSPTVAMQGEE